MKGELFNLKRSSKGQILRTNKMLSSSNLIVELADASNTMFMVLNINRQIILANKTLLQIINTPNNNILGKRPGEIFNCVNAFKLETGCGTHPFCKECGAAKAISDALKGKTSQNECRISSIINNQNISFDLLVKCQPITYLQRRFILMSVIDISDNKRREILEKTFFHDILNTAGGVYSFSRILRNKINPKDSTFKLANTTCRLADRLVKEIKGQQLLLNAEKNNLQLNITKINFNQLINDTIDLVKENNILPKCKFRRYFLKDNILLKTDEILLQRVLLNLIKNATEASSVNDNVSIKVINEGNLLIFSVHNKAFIPEKIQHQLFQRSFSTKGANRGIGTYSVKLFTENYMQGKVWFKSTKSKGTYFYVQLPLELID